MLKKTIIRKIFGFNNISYSQRGEDIIIYNYLKYECHLNNYFYIDVGCYDPIKYSNTYYFYKRNGNGICIDPQKKLKRKYKNKRPKDLFIGKAISNKNNETLYLFKHSIISTTSIEEKQLYERLGYSVKKEINVATENINNILKLANRPIDFLNIDCEGKDLEILKTIDFNKYKPKVICIETIEPETGKKNKNYNIIKKTLENYDYKILADTIVNTIFVKK